MSSDIPVQYTHSIKLEDTAKGVRISVHVYSNDRETAIADAILTYRDTKSSCEEKKILVAPWEISKS
jgi:hypothetical protein